YDKIKKNEEIDRIKKETASQVKPLANNKYINTPAHIDCRALHMQPANNRQKQDVVQYRFFLANSQFFRKIFKWHHLKQFKIFEAVQQSGHIPHNNTNTIEAPFNMVQNTVSDKLKKQMECIMSVSKPAISPRKLDSNAIELNDYHKTLVAGGENTVTIEEIEDWLDEDEGDRVYHIMAEEEIVKRNEVMKHVQITFAWSMLEVDNALVGGRLTGRSILFLHARISGKKFAQLYLLRGISLFQTMPRYKASGKCSNSDKIISELHADNLSDVSSYELSDDEEGDDRLSIPSSSSKRNSLTQNATKRKTIKNKENTKSKVKINENPFMLVQNREETTIQPIDNSVNKKTGTMVIERQNTIVITFIERDTPRPTAYDIYEWIHNTLKILPEDIAALQLNGITIQVYIKCKAQALVEKILLDTNGESYYIHERGQRTKVTIDSAGLGIRYVKVYNLPTEVPNHNI
ncbi:hypothetical protein C0J52_24089, partial [Blattella germanica]